MSQAFDIHSVLEKHKVPVFVKPYKDGTVHQIIDEERESCKGQFA